MGGACLTLSLGWRSMWSFSHCGARRHARNSSASTLPDSVLSCSESLASRSLRSHAGQKESNQIATLRPWPSSKGVNRLHLLCSPHMYGLARARPAHGLFCGRTLRLACDFLPLTACSLPLPSLSGFRPGPCVHPRQERGSSLASTWGRAPAWRGAVIRLYPSHLLVICSGTVGEKRRKASLPGRPSRPGSLPRQGPCARLFPRAPKIACEALHWPCPCVFPSSSRKRLCGAVRACHCRAPWSLQPVRLSRLACVCQMASCV